MAIASALILHLGQDLTFYRDEWTFVIYRDGHDLTNFISSYAGHLLLWPTALYVFLFHAVGLDDYGVYRLVGLLGHLACALLVYLLARRRVGDVVALAPAAVLLFLGSAWMDVLWPMQIVYTGALVFGLAAILALSREDLLGDALACLSLTIALGWSALGLPFLPGVATGLLVRRRLLRRIWVVAVPAAAYLLWALTSGDQHVDYAEMAHVPGYLLELAGAGIAGIGGLPAATGPLLAIVLAVPVAFRLRSLGRQSPLAWEALALAISFWAVTAVARVQEHDPTAVRYVYPSVVFLLLLAVGLAPPRVPRGWVAAAVLALAALCLPSNIADLSAGSNDLRETSFQVSAELGAMQLARDRVSPEYTPELHGFPDAVPAAPFFAATDRYGSSPAATPREIADSPAYARHRADATSIAALRVGLHVAPGEGYPAVRRASFGASAGSIFRRSGGCVTADGGKIDLVGLVPPVGLSIRSASRVAVGLRRFGDDFSRLPESVPPDSTGFLDIPADRERTRPWKVRLVSRRGPLRVC
jgi:hypothetical protein